MVRWRKSSRSGGVTDNACVELARLGASIGVRHSTDPEGPHLGLSSRDFGGLVARIRLGELDGRQGS